MNIGKTIIKLRKKANMSQDDLAARLNVSRQTISKWENDVVLPDAYNLKEIAALFDISVDELLDNKVVKEDNQLIEAINYGGNFIVKHWQKYGYALIIMGFVVIGFHFIVKTVIGTHLNMQNQMGLNFGFGLETQNSFAEFYNFAKIPLYLGIILLVIGITLVIYDRIKMNKLNK